MIKSTTAEVKLNSINSPPVFLFLKSGRKSRMSNVCADVGQNVRTDGDRPALFRRWRSREAEECQRAAQDHGETYNHH